MCSNPLDEYDPMRIVDRHHQPVVIALDVENHPVRSNNAGIRIRFQDIGWTFPVCSEQFMDPCVER